MKLLYPEFLYALLALAIPIIIHLFNFRKFKRVIFPNTRFLKEVELQTKSRSRLKHLLVLFSRLAAIACLVLAFAQPFIPTDNSNVVAGQKAVSIYIDNSFTMDQEDEAGKLLSQAKDMAEQIVKGYAQSDRFQLLTNEFEGRQQRLVSRDEFLELLDEVQIGPSTRKISEVHSRLTDALDKEDSKAKRAFLFSDMQESTTDLTTLEADSSISFNLIPMRGNEVGNVYIDTLWFKNPVRQLNAQEELTVRVINSSGKKLNNVPIRLSINGVQKAIGNISLLPYSVADSVMKFNNTESGIMEAQVSINDHPIVFDDIHHFAYDIARRCDILLIKSKVASRIEALFRDDDSFLLTTAKPNTIDYAIFKDQQVIILESLDRISSGLIQELMKFVNNGGSLVILPSSSIDKDSYNELYLALDCNSFSVVEEDELKVTSVDTEHPIFDGVFNRIPRQMDLPTVKAYLAFFKRTQSREQRLMSLANGNSFASVYPKGRGHTYCFAVGTDTDMSNFTRHSFFVTTLLRIAEMSHGDQRLYHTIGNGEVLESNVGQNSNQRTFELEATNGSIAVLPEVRNRGSRTEFLVHGQITVAGMYRLKYDEEHRDSFGFNYSREESEMKFYSAEEIAEQIGQAGLSNFKLIQNDKGSFTTAVQDISEGRKLWKTFIILTLLFLGIEVLLLKFMKT